MLLLALVVDGTRAGPIEDLAPGHWYAVPNSRMHDVCPPNTSTYPYFNLCPGVIYYFSGGAYDTKRDRLIVWGGWPTASGYYGNEVYVFDVNTLRWQRLNDPSPYFLGRGSPGNPVENPDGTPIQRHTYDGLEYIPTIDRFFVQGGAFGGYGDRNTWLFNFDTFAWTKVALAPGSEFDNLTAYDPVTGTVLERATDVFARYDPIANRWTTIGSGENFATANKTGAFDPKRRVFVSIGIGEAYIIRNVSPTASGLREERLTTTGATEILAAKSPGFEYDPVSDRFIAWSGGAQVYALNMDTLVWARLPAASTNTVTPTAPASAGTYGRFRYMPSKNAFILVNDADQNVYIYKLSAAGGSTTPPTFLQFAPASYSAGEGNDETVTVTRTGSSAGAVSVNYTASGGSAQAGTDYAVTNGTLTWADGDMLAKPITVSLIDDADIEASETINLQLSGPTGGAILGQATAVLNIVDNDGPNEVAFIDAVYSGGEGSGSAIITVIRRGDTSVTATVAYATSDGTAQAGSDYTAVSGTLSFAPGVVSRTFSVPIINDSVFEGSQTVMLTLSDATGVVLGAQSAAVLNITDDDGSISPGSTPPSSGGYQSVTGGCALRPGAGFDPVLLLLALLAAVEVARRARHSRRLPFGRR